MRLTKEMIKLVSSRLTKSLLDEEFIIFTEDPSELEKVISSIIVEDLMIEDRLNDEVKKIMASYADEIDRGNVQYGTMFQMIKRKLVRERDLVL